MVKQKGMQFFIIMMKMKRKRDKKIDQAKQGLEPRIFEQIPAQNLNFEGDQINRAWGSQNFWTLLMISLIQIWLMRVLFFSDCISQGPGVNCTCSKQQNFPKVIQFAELLALPFTAASMYICFDYLLQSLKTSFRVTP